jgi:hypothetical protein
LQIEIVAPIYDMKKQRVSRQSGTKGIQQSLRLLEEVALWLDFEEGIGADL